MRISKKIAALAVSMSAAAFMVVAVPASAQVNSIIDTKLPTPGMVKVASAKNNAVEIDTELDCSRHTLTARVTNITDSKISPFVTFNKFDPALPLPFPIDPGKTGSYVYNFSGNHTTIEVKVLVDGYDEAVVSPTLHCNEPVSFTVTQSSKSAVVGYLRNNSTLVQQTVLTRVDSGDVRIEMLQPGEARLIALPFMASENQLSAMVTIATTSGYESTYTVDLEEPIIIFSKK